MAHNPHAHLQKEIESLRKQLIQERDQRRFDNSLFITNNIKQAEERTLERCIVECMEEANAPTYTEEEKVAILTCIQRVQEMINHLSPTTTGVDYAHNFVKQAPLTPAGVQAQVMAAIAPEGKSL